ncbi:hypothetical protein THOM_1266 [Trachipleistophora hominis]|uniref:Uncharacterized protein n=1 Tax=Trachipleistophora hominis TaxID=72359 RepID=L7JWX8_TRAHO|nr:hypothetical protein THOM_1266 [Trachipleistophora hominis]
MDCGITNGENLDCDVGAAFEPQEVKNRATIYNLSEFEVSCWMNDHTPGKFTCVSEPIVQRDDSKYMGNWKIGCTKDNQEESAICTIGSNNARSRTVKLMKMGLQCDELNNNPITCFSDVTLERFDNNDKAANISMILEKAQAFTDNIHIPVTTDPVLASKNFDRVLAIFKQMQVPTNTNTMILTCIMPLFVIVVILTSIFWYFKKRSRPGIRQNNKRR